MTERIARELILSLLGDDAQLLADLCNAGVLPRDETALRREHAEVARVAYTLVHELEVNMAGVEVILRLREELTATRRQVAELLTLLQSNR